MLTKTSVGLCCAFVSTAVSTKVSVGFNRIVTQADAFQ